MILHKECIYEYFQVIGENSRGVHQNSSQTQGGASRLLNTLEGKIFARGSTIEVVENFERLFQVCIERMQGVCY
jgi:hypothetical protein